MKTEKKFKILVIIQFFLLLVTLLIGAWWGTLLLNQSEKISELEMALGRSSAEASFQNLKLHKMLFWESGAFFFLLILMSVLIVWLYWRDIKRTKKLHAFFASVTHELKTPLTSIRLQAESLSESQDQERLTQRLLEDTTRLEAQVNRTLELARLEGGGPILLESFPVKPHLENLIQYWKETQSRPFDIELHVENEWIQADRDALEIIFKNLLENSLKYANQTPLSINIQSKKNSDGTFELFYQDNGNSFHGEKDSLGTLFYKGPHSKGTGVGLYLVQTLMKKMKGFVEFQPTSKGFFVRLQFQGAEK